MSEYNLEFAEAMSESSGLILRSDSLPEEGQRAALYTALVACEIALKYALAEFGAAKFPNEIRYGHTLKHFPASVMQQASLQLISWVRRHAPSIQS